MDFVVLCLLSNDKQRQGSNEKRTNNNIQIPITSHFSFVICSCYFYAWFDSSNIDVWGVAESNIFELRWAALKGVRNWGEAKQCQIYYFNSFTILKINHLECLGVHYGGIFRLSTS